jgi:photosystem II stability/assembly factor-like uncharacterized protein
MEDTKMKKQVLMMILWLLAKPTFAQWQQVATYTQFSGRVFSIVEKQPYLFVGSDNGIYRGSNDGTNWVNVNNTIASSFDTGMISLTVWNESIFAGNVNVSTNAIYRSTNNGTNWTLKTDSLTVPAGELYATTQAVFASAGLYETTAHHFYRTTDNGETWNVITTLPFALPDAITTDGDTLYAANGVFYQIYRSINNGDSWTPLLSSNLKGFSQPSPFPYHTYDALGAKGQNMYATYTSHFDTGNETAILIRSTNGGATWDYSYIGLPAKTTAQNFAFSGNTVFMTGFHLTSNLPERRVYYSTNQGTSWEAWNTGLANSIEACCIVVTQNYVYIGTTDDGIWRRPLTQLAVKDIPSEKPTSFALEQNYPNPFNPSTVIRYQLAVSSQTTLKVYDVLGREVATLVNERQAAGNHDVKFDASKLTSGIYFYRLTVGGYTQTKKMLFVK